MNSFALILILCILLEAVINTVKLIYDTTTREVNVPLIISILLSVTVAVFLPVDLFELVDLPFSIPYIGSVLTGIVISRGTKVVHELLAKLE